MSRLRKILWAAVALAAAGGLALLFRPEPVAVDTAAVGRGALRITVDEEGRTRVKETYVVSAPIEGRVLRIDAKVGDPVEAGRTVIATIVPSAPAFLDIRTRAEAAAAVKAAEAAYALAKAERDRARAELDFAQAELARARALAERGTISQAALDRAELAAKTRRAALAEAEAALNVRIFEVETAQARLIDPDYERKLGGHAADCCIAVPAPISGRVLKVMRESEGVVDAGAPLVEIGDPRDLEIVVDLLSTEAVRVSEGAPVDIVGWGGGETLAGTVRRIEPFGFTKISALGIEEQRVNVIVAFDSPAEAWARLGHGYRVETRIEVWRGEDVLLVPVGALFREGADWACFVVAGGRARLRRLTLGRMNDQAAAVEAGLEAGETVVLHPSDRIADGSRVTLRARP